MSDDLVKNERNAVKTLRTGVSRYAEHIREAMAHARKDLTALHRGCEGAVEQRRAQLQRAERELQEAKAALAQCREHCGGLQQQVAIASQRVGHCKQELDKARRAAHIVAQAQHELVSVMQGIEKDVGEHSSVASSALADLEARITALGGDHHLYQTVAGIAVGAVALIELVNPIKDVGNALNAIGLPNQISDATSSELAERRDEQGRGYVVEEQEKEEHRRMYGGT